MWALDHSKLRWLSVWVWGTYVRDLDWMSSLDGQLVTEPVGGSLFPFSNSKTQRMHTSSQQTYECILHITWIKLTLKTDCIKCRQESGIIETHALLIQTICKTVWQLFRIHICLTIQQSSFKRNERIKGFYKIVHIYLNHKSSEFEITQIFILGGKLWFVYVYAFCTY